MIAFKSYVLLFKNQKQTKKPQALKRRTKILFLKMLNIFLELFTQIIKIIFYNIVMILLL